MSINRSFVELNQASTERIRRFGVLSDAELQTQVGEHWTAAIALAHLAFWDRRVLQVLDLTERNGSLTVPQIDVLTNDLSLLLWAAIPPREAARLALEAAETLDARLQAYPAGLLERVYVYNARWVERFRHRNEHLDEVAAAVGREI